MKNNFFSIEFNSMDGTVKSIVNPNDKDNMNWCTEKGGWGKILGTNIESEEHSREVHPLPLISFIENEEESCSVYENNNIKVTVKRFFCENGNYCERYILKNLRSTDLFLEHGELGIKLPFNDVYTYADECMIKRCNTHIWCGYDVTHINALKMGKSDINLGLCLTKGSIKSYSVNDCGHSRRGIFVMNCGHIELLPQEEYIFEWQLFWHKGKEDFLYNLRSFEKFIEIKADYFTLPQENDIVFDICTKLPLDNAEIICDGEKVDFTKTENGCKVKYTPKHLCEHKFLININGVCTYAEFFVTENTEKMLERRINFIVDKQQYHKEGSCLDGAFLIYDNKEKYQVFNSVIRDHNACRERMGMTLLIAKYLQTHNNPKFRKALDKCVEFVLREVVDTETGEVFDGAGKAKQFVRLYNAPWITSLFTEMYYLTKETKYLDYTYTILKYYYSVGGRKFYPNGLSMYRTYTAFKSAEMVIWAEDVKKMFISHADNMLSNGTSYPKHEVNFEQTIVSPAATFISEIAFITDLEKYKTAAKDHIEILERFNGSQPSFHLNEIPIRFWDDFWFGKGRLYGDTFPHYWSCLTARAYAAYYRFSKNEDYKKAALMCIENCFCLFNQTGEGSCAYVYPYKLNGEKGSFYDEWANDQDFALYFYLIISEIFEN